MLNWTAKSVFIKKANTGKVTSQKWKAQIKDCLRIEDSDKEKQHLLLLF